VFAHQVSFRKLFFSVLIEPFFLVFSRKDLFVLAQTSINLVCPRTNQLKHFESCDVLEKACLRGRRDISQAHLTLSTSLAHFCPWSQSVYTACCSVSIDLACNSLHLVLFQKGLVVFQKEARAVSHGPCWWGRSDLAWSQRHPTHIITWEQGKSVSPMINISWQHNAYKQTSCLGWTRDCLPDWAECVHKGVCRQLEGGWGSSYICISWSVCNMHLSLHRANQVGW
jgi:hypothetical protein